MLIIETFEYLYWEICLLLVSVRLANICGWNDDTHRSERLLAWLSISIVLSAGIATVYSFALLNGSVSYLGTARRYGNILKAFMKNSVAGLSLCQRMEFLLERSGWEIYRAYGNSKECIDKT
jgi:hypothetical protein